LSAAERLFHHYGPAKTTVADIARECDIGVGTVYLDFPSKDAIVAALNERRAGTVAARMRAAARAKDVPTRINQMSRARIEALFDLAEGGIHACELVKCGAPGRAFTDDVRELVRTELERGVENGQLAVDDVDAVLDSFELALIALSPPYVFKSERHRAVELGMRLGEMLVRGLEAGKSRGTAAKKRRD
jgi:AcrR family transcriptional regulator